MNELSASSTYYQENFSRSVFPSALPSYCTQPWRAILRSLESYPPRERRVLIERFRYGSAFWTTLFRAVHLVLLRSEPDSIALAASSRMSIFQAIHDLFAQSVAPPRIFGEYVIFTFPKEAKPLLSPYLRTGRILREPSSDLYRYEVHFHSLIKALVQCMSPWQDVAGK